MVKLFVYGTLRYPSTRISIVGRECKIGETTLKGYRKLGLNIIEDETTEVEGDILEVDNKELARLDRYEGYPWGYRRIKVSPENYSNIEAYQINDTTY